MGVVSRFSTAWTNLSPYQKSVFNFSGFYKFPEPIWITFLPYVLMFFFAIMVVPVFKNKIQQESIDLTSVDAIRMTMIETNEAPIETEAGNEKTEE